jgi:hypothetical protein
MHCKPCSASLCTGKARPKIIRETEKLKGKKRGINTEMKKVKYRLHSNSSNLLYMI